jgi:hypothetical protein
LITACEKEGKIIFVQDGTAFNARDREYRDSSEYAKNTLQLEPREYATAHVFAIIYKKLLL